jgi:hypothetical protein
VTVGCTPSGRRFSTIPRPLTFSTIGPHCSARTASGLRCRRLSSPHLPTYARLATQSATFSSHGQRSIARGCTRSTRRSSAPPPTRSVQWEPRRLQHPSAAGDAARRPALRDLYCWHRRRLRSSDRTSGTRGAAPHLRARLNGTRLRPSVHEDGGVQAGPLTRRSKPD